jgi:hypothetical protein
MEYEGWGGYAGWGSGRPSRGDWTGAGVVDSERRVHTLGTAGPLKLQGGGRIWSMKVGADMPVGAVGGRAAEIGRGRVFLPERQVRTAWPLKLQGGGRIWSM